MRMDDEDNPFLVQARNGWTRPKPPEPIVDDNVVKYAGLLLSRVAEVIAGSVSDEPFAYAQTAVTAIARAGRAHKLSKSGGTKRSLEAELRQVGAALERLDTLAIAQSEATLEAFDECKSFLATLERLLRGADVREG